jgi:hypothetical protein
MIELSNWQLLDKISEARSNLQYLQSQITRVQQELLCEEECIYCRKWFLETKIEAHEKRCKKFRFLPPKGRRFSIKDGYALKRKARIRHECTRCGRVIPPNEEYYQLNYRDSWTKYPVCETCWSGKKFAARNSFVYKDTGEVATEGKRDYWW